MAMHVTILEDSKPGQPVAPQAPLVGRESSLDQAYGRTQSYHIMSTAAPKQYRVSAGVFLRAVGALYFVSFFHLSFQVIGLIGENGISPAQRFVERMSDFAFEKESQFLYGPVFYPSIFWYSAADDMLRGACFVGVLLSAALILGIGHTKLNLLFLYVTKLSFCVVGGDLFAFPWDYLLMETTILSLFFPSLKPLFLVLSKLTGETEAGVGSIAEPVPMARWAIIFLCVRFMLAMGLEKVPFVNNCEEWENWTYIKWFYEREQPMPTALAWYAFHLPMWFHEISCLATWIIEVVIPLFAFWPSFRVRKWCGIMLIFLQIPIMITGNYSILNWLTIVLCIPMLDDTCFVSGGGAPMKSKNASPSHDVGVGVMPLLKEPAGQSTLEERELRPPRECGLANLFRRVGPVLRAMFLGSHALLGLLYTFRILEDGGVSYLANPSWIMDRRNHYSDISTIAPKEVLLWLQRYHIIQQYGGVFYGTFDHQGKLAFIIEGSMDGALWKEYTYEYHIQDVQDSPRFFAPLFPRMDHMIFYESNGIGFNKINPFSPLFNPSASGSWFLGLVQRLLEAESSVTNLFHSVPFGRQRPTYVRVNLYQYRFTKGSTESKDWWTRKFVTEVLPPVTIDNADEKNAFAVCFYILTQVGTFPPPEIRELCTVSFGEKEKSREEGNHPVVRVYDFDNPTNIYRHSATLAMLLPMLLSEAYLESIRDVVHFNEEFSVLGNATGSLSQDVNVYRHILYAHSECRLFMLNSLPWGKLRNNLINGKGLSWRQFSRVLGSADIEENTARRIMSVADLTPSFDRMVSFDELVACRECLYELCGSGFFESMADRLKKIVSYRKPA